MKVINTARKAYIEIFDGWTIIVIRGLNEISDVDLIFTSLVRQCGLRWAPDAEDFIHWRCCGIEARIECPTFFDQGEPRETYLVCSECGIAGIRVCGIRNYLCELEGPKRA